MKRQLLVIDDDPDILHVLKANLELYGYDPVLARDWAAAKNATSAWNSSETIRKYPSSC
jgi:DNA-binding NtrC family response regulator